MDLIYSKTDQNGVQTSGYLTNYDVAFDVSTDVDYVTNNFELTMVLPETADDLLWAENQISTIIYVDGTEYGGEITGSVIDIGDKTIKYTGRTWRGNLSQWIIEPPAGQDYLIVSGNLATSLRLLPMGDYIMDLRVTKAIELVKANVDVVVVDSAHGHSENILRAVREIKGAFPDLALIAGNVATGDATRALIEAGASRIGASSGKKIVEGCKE